MLEAPLKALAAHYFFAAKSRGQPADPVARFHLGNGAVLERINFPGDASPKGLSQSHGLMVNYLYNLKEIEKNHEAYANQGRVTSSRQVRNLLRPYDAGALKSSDDGERAHVLALAFDPSRSTRPGGPDDP